MTTTDAQAYVGISGRSEYFASFSDTPESINGGDYDDVIASYNHNDHVIAGLGRDYVRANDGDDVIFGDRYAVDEETNVNPSLAAAADAIWGEAGNDIIFAGGGNNFVNGGAGMDSIYGGGGNEHLAGGEGDDRVFGGAGNDTLYGGSASGAAQISFVDTYVGSVTTGFDGVNDQPLSTTRDGSNYGLIGVAESNTGSDYLDGGAGNDSIYGGDGADILLGGEGNDLLDGGDGSDSLDGGVGDDVYLLGADTADTITDIAGKDTISSTITRSLAGYGDIENLTLSGSGNISATGNALNNLLVGNSGKNVLDGGAGADKLMGGAGNDVYILGSDTTDTIVDTAGTDTISTTISRSLAGYAAIENLTLAGSGNINGTGNTLNNLLTGNSGNNLLAGGLGNDTLNGGAGADSYLFNTALNAATNVDTLVFSVAADTIQLENSIFTQLTSPGFISSANLAINASGSAQDGNDFIIYETDTGNLFYDADGNGAGGSVLFAKIGAGLGVTTGDFLIV
jgi:serralysin